MGDVQMVNCGITSEQRSLFFRTPLCFEGRILTRSPAQVLNYQSMTTSCQGSPRRVFQYAAAILERDKFPKTFPSCVLLGPINSVANDE